MDAFDTNTGSFNDGFWKEFAARDWGKRAVVFKDSLPQPLLSSEQLFQAMLVAADRLRNRDRRVSMRFYIAGKMHDIRSYLPREEDGSTVGYSNRVREELKGQDFTLLLADLHLYDHAFWRRVCRFLDDLYPHIGRPDEWAGWVDTTLFLGQYRRTPFGVHDGPMDVMTFPVDGTKRFRTWFADYVRQNHDLPDSHSYEQHLPASSIYEAKAGDVMYWPSGLWHIAESSGEHSAAWSLGFWVGHPLADPDAHLLEVLRRSMAQIPRDQDDPRQRARSCTLKQSSSTGMPASWDDAVHRMKSMYGELDVRMRIEWARSVSGRGFREVPSPADSPALKSGDKITLAPDAKILISAGPAGQMCIAAQGHLCFVPEFAPLAHAMQSMSTGGKVQVGQLLALAEQESADEQSTGLSSDDLGQLLDHLLGIRALTIAES